MLRNQNKLFQLEMEKLKSSIIGKANKNETDNDVTGDIYDNNDANYILNLSSKIHFNNSDEFYQPSSVTNLKLILERTDFKIPEFKIRNCRICR